MRRAPSLPRFGSIDQVDEFLARVRAALLAGFE